MGFLFLLNTLRFQFPSPSKASCTLRLNDFIANHSTTSVVDIASIAFLPAFSNATCRNSKAHAPRSCKASGMASCSMCTHRAASSSCLVKHVLKVHQHHANFVVHCSHTGCGQTYRKWKSFVQHLRRRHGDDSGILNTTEEETSMDPVPDLEDTSSA